MEVKQFLSQQQIPFDVLPHPYTETAIGTALSLTVPEETFAKTVVVKVDGRPVVAVLQSPYRVDVDEVGKVLGGGHAALANEEELESFFPDCEAGVVLPFGSHYGMETIVDLPLTMEELLYFEGNTHHEAICIRYKDYQMIERPHEADISLPTV